MARPLRLNIAGGWYHVWSRGVNRGIIFRDDDDRYHMLEVLGRASERYRIAIHAYVLMDNHYHLIADTPEGNLSKAMQWISTSYSMWHNRRHGRIGPLFQGRYGSSLIEDSRWAYELSVYLHLNPVRTAAYDWGKRRRKAENAGLSRDPTPEEVSSKLKAVREYKWSSYRAYAGYRMGLKWVELRKLLKRTGKRSRADQQKAYRKDVQAWIKRGVEETRVERLRDKLAIGTEAFIDRLKGGIGRPGREETGKARMSRRTKFEDVVHAVEQLKAEAWVDFKARHGDSGKGHVYWFSREFCGMTHSEIGAACGGVDYGAVCMALRRYETALEKNRRLRNDHNTVKKQLLYVKT